MELSDEKLDENQLAVIDVATEIKDDVVNTKPLILAEEARTVVFSVENIKNDINVVVIKIGLFEEQKVVVTLEKTNEHLYSVLDVVVVVNENRKEVLDCEQIVEKDINVPKVLISKVTEDICGIIVMVVSFLVG